MHPSYFSEKFHDRTGETLTNFLAALRVNKARQLLAYTALPISEIAFASGFRSLSQFNRVYKKRTGHAPGEDRR
jgi:AraC-like DNA-binding protein